jgi:hypothetical protein
MSTRSLPREPFAIFGIGSPATSMRRTVGRVWRHTARCVPCWPRTTDRSTRTTSPKLLGVVPRRLATTKQTSRHFPSPSVATRSTASTIRRVSAIATTRPSAPQRATTPRPVYMITTGNYQNGGCCCFDYGNAETNSMDNGAGNGPWVMGDLENGLWAGNTSPYEGNTPVTYKYITAMVKRDRAGTNHWTIEVGYSSDAADDAVQANIVSVCGQ